MGVEGSANTEKAAGVDINPFQHETGVDILYGEKTWKPVQSVIEVVQNHLDANTTVYERSLLSSVGITEYNPKDTQQQRTVTLLNKIKYSSEPEEAQTAYTDLRSIIDTPPQLEGLHEQLEGINYPMPRMRLKVTNGEQSKSVEYSETTTLPAEWEITGFRIEDEGTGFDSRLLGMMGVSTRRESSSKRGRFGAGLKMSVTHLTRLGAKIRLFSHNDDQLWFATPHVEGGTVSFRGKQRAETDPHQTGSLTDVDFSNPDFDTDVRTEITQALDPRKGEGLGKYVLEFRGPDFIPFIESPAELTSHGVPGGRVYVKGLLVEEADNLLFSYNLSEKWAITGRDRKTVQQQLLARIVNQALATLQDQEQIAAVVEKLKERNNFVEIKGLNGDLNLADEQQEAWRLAVQGAFAFTPGEAVFASDMLTPEQQRVATERGFQVIRLPSGNVHAIDLIKKLYPDQIVAFKDLDAPSARVEEIVIPLPDQVMADMPVTTQEQIKTPEAILTDEIQETLGVYKDTFIKIVTENAIKQHIRRKPLVLLGIDRLLSVKFAPARVGMVFEGDSSFSYDPDRNVLYVKDGVSPDDFQSIADLYVQLSKVQANKNVFSQESQVVVTVMAGEAVMAMRPELLTDFQIEGNGHTKREKPVMYPQEQREQDDRTIAFFQKLRELHTPGITFEELTESLGELRSLRTTDVPEGHYFDKGNSVFYIQGEVYQISGRDLSIGKVDFSGRPTKRTSLSQSKPGFRNRLLTTDSTDFSLEGYDNVYLPYELQDGESMTLTFTHEEGESQIVLKRKGSKTIARRIIDGREEAADEMYKNYVFESMGTAFDVYNNVLVIRAIETNSVVVDKNLSGRADQLQESNRGKDFIQTNITLDYGGEVWRDPRRILLDAVQNHIDAQGNRVPTVAYTVLSPDGTIERVSKEALQERDETWKIIGVEVHDDGAGYTTPYLTRLGTSTKGDHDRGKYGEGLKMLTAAAVRQGITVEASSRDWIARPTHHTQTVKDYETGREQAFEFLGYEMHWQEQPQTGSSTTFSLLPAGAGDALTAEQKTELEAKLSPDSPQGAIWQSWVDVLDPRKADQFGQRGLDRYVLPDDEGRSSDGIVTVLPDRNGSIYEKGLLIPREAQEPMLFGYNIDETIIDTRERNAFNKELLDRYLADYFQNLTDTTVMRHILEMTKQQRETDFYEYKFIRDLNTSAFTKALWRRTYFEVFGKDAVLSLQPIHLSMERQASRAGMYALNLLKSEDAIGREREYKEAVAKAVAIEAHVPTLQTLPLDLTIFFDDQVYTSRDFKALLEGSEVDLPGDEKEKLVALIRATNQMMLTMLESLDSNRGSRDYLGKIISPEKLARRKEQLGQMTAEDVRIKHASFPALGMVEEVDGKPVTYLNQSIITKPAEIITTHVHEASHYLSGQPDYVLNFQRFMMALAISQTQFARPS